MKFLVPNYSCLQDPWLGGYSPQIPILSVLYPQLNFLNYPPPNKIPGYATAVGCMRWCYSPQPHQLQLELKYNIARCRIRVAMSYVYRPTNGSITRLTVCGSLRLAYGNAHLFYKYHVTWIRVNVRGLSGNYPAILNISRTGRVALM